MVQSCGVGVYASAGLATISDSTIEYNDYGVWQDTDGINIGIIDISGCVF